MPCESMAATKRCLLAILCVILLVAFGCDHGSQFKHEPARDQQKRNQEIPPATAQEIKLLQEILNEDPATRPRSSISLWTKPALERQIKHLISCSKWPGHILVWTPESLPGELSKLFPAIRALWLS